MDSTLGRNSSKQTWRTPEHVDVRMDGHIDICTSRGTVAADDAKTGATEQDKGVGSSNHSAFAGGGLLLRTYLHFSPAGATGDLVAPVGPELGGAGPQHVLVVGGGDGGADQWPHPEDPLHEHKQQSARGRQISGSGAASLEVYVMYRTDEAIFIAYLI